MCWIKSCGHILNTLAPRDCEGSNSVHWTLEESLAEMFLKLRSQMAVSFFSGLVTGTGGSLRDKGL